MLIIGPVEHRGGSPVAAMPEWVLSDPMRSSCRLRGQPSSAETMWLAPMRCNCSARSERAIAGEGHHLGGLGAPGEEGVAARA
jgi:hypothetical protein